MEIKKLTSKTIFRGRVITLTVDRVQLPGGRETDLECIRHPGAAAIVPIDDDDQVLMLRQYRHATGDWLLEVPAGTLDPGESLETCAAREVEEETGYRAGKLQSLGWVWTTPGFTDEKIELFLATELQLGEQQLDGDELLEVVRFPFDEAVRRAAHGDVRDAKSVCALLRAASFRADR